MTAFSGHKDLVYTLVAVAPVPAATGTSLTVTAGTGAQMPATLPFYGTLAPAGVLPTLANAEVVKVTVRVGDVLTVVRAQGGTTGKPVAVGWAFFPSVTAEWAVEVETAINTIETNAVFDTDPAGGDLAGTYPSPTLAVIGAGAGPLGDGTNVPVVTVDTKGRVTALTSTPITGAPPSGVAGGDLDGFYPNPTLDVLGLATGPIGDGTNVATTTIDTKGRVTGLTATPIAFPAAAPVGASYITQVPEAGLSGEQALSALATGLLKSTTVTGVVSIAGSTDYISPDLYDANTVLAADVDNTPAALTMGASTILARLAAGNIKAASVAEIITLLQAYTVGGTDVALADGGTGASLVDPNADRILFWDDSAGSTAFLTAGTGLTITGTTIDATAATPVEDYANSFLLMGG